MIAKALMRHPVFTISADAGLDRAMVIMASKRVRHLPVVDDHPDLIGLISDRDLRLVMKDMEGPQHAPKGLFLPALTKVKTVMKTTVHTVELDTSALDVAHRMVSFKIGCLPVVEKGGKKV